MAGGKTLCCIGGGTETEAQVLIYEASDDTLAKWDYKGVMCSRPVTTMRLHLFRKIDPYLALI